MATQRQSFPTIPARAWWELRRRFQTTMPSKVTASYVASALDMTPPSADANVLPALREMGLIEEDGTPTDLAIRWRDDSEYADVAEEIRENTYPQELRDLAPPNDADRGTVQSWFARKTAAGQSATRKMASAYMLLAEADPDKAKTKGSTTSTPTPGTRNPKPKPKPKARISEKGAASKLADGAGGGSARQKVLPQVAFNIQVVLPSDGNAETYDQIFASIAKHLMSSEPGE